MLPSPLHLGQSRQNHLRMLLHLNLTNHLAHMADSTNLHPRGLRVLAQEEVLTQSQADLHL
jgi:hypothetical protein